MIIAVIDFLIFLFPLRTLTSEIATVKAVQFGLSKPIAFLWIAY